MSNPDGFQHPIQVAYVSYLGFHAVVVTVHLSWPDTDMREKKKKPVFYTEIRAMSQIL